MLSSSPRRRPAAASSTAVSSTSSSSSSAEAAAAVAALYRRVSLSPRTLALVASGASSTAASAMAYSGGPMGEPVDSRDAWPPTLSTGAAAAVAASPFSASYSGWDRYSGDRGSHQLALPEPVSRARSEANAATRAGPILPFRPDESLLRHHHDDIGGYYGHGRDAAFYPGGGGGGGVRPNHILLFSILDPRHPINTSVLERICRGLARVVRIVMIRKHEADRVRAMVEFRSVADAERVRDHLDGRKIYDDSCRLRIEFAFERVYRLRVVRNDEDSWDFTGELDRRPSSSSYAPPPPPRYRHPREEGIKRRAASPDWRSSPRKYLRTEGGYGGGGGGKSYYSGREERGWERRDGGIAPLPSVMSGNARYHDHSRYGAGGPVCMVYDLNIQMATPQRLFNLFCLYGDVMRVKFLASKEGCAMVEMRDAETVGRVIVNLGGSRLFGSDLVVRPSFQSRILGSSELGATTVRLSNGALAFEDFSGCPNNRFRSPDRASKNRIVPPSHVLHFFNLPTECGEDDVWRVFQGKAAANGENAGGGNSGGVDSNNNSDSNNSLPSSIKLFPRFDGSRTLSGLAVFPSAEAATNALALHNHTLIPRHCPQQQQAQGGEGGGREQRPHTFKLCFSVQQDKIE